MFSQFKECTEKMTRKNSTNSGFRIIIAAIHKKIEYSICMRWISTFEILQNHYCVQVVNIPTVDLALIKTHCLNTIHPNNSSLTSIGIVRWKK